MAALDRGGNGGFRLAMMASSDRRRWRSDGGGLIGEGGGLIGEAAVPLI